MAAMVPQSVDIRHSNTYNIKGIMQPEGLLFPYFLMIYMICVSTFEDLNRQDYGLALYCMSCNRWGEADLNRLIQTGHGDKPVTEARFRCRDCGELVEKQLRPPVPSLGGAVAYICR